MPRKRIQFPVRQFDLVPAQLIEAAKKIYALFVSDAASPDPT